MQQMLSSDASIYRILFLSTLGRLSIDFRHIITPKFCSWRSIL